MVEVMGLAGGALTFGKMTLWVKCLFATHSINDRKVLW
jgi:hypothetical protein